MKKYLMSLILGFLLISVWVSCSKDEESKYSSIVHFNNFVDIDKYIGLVRSLGYQFEEVQYNIIRHSEKEDYSFTLWFEYGNTYNMHDYDIDFKLTYDFYGIYYANKPERVFSVEFGPFNVRDIPEVPFENPYEFYLTEDLPNKLILNTDAKIYNYVNLWDETLPLIMKICQQNSFTLKNYSGKIIGTDTFTNDTYTIIPESAANSNLKIFELLKTIKNVHYVIECYGHNVTDDEQRSHLFDVTFGPFSISDSQNITISPETNHIISLSSQ